MKRQVNTGEVEAMTDDELESIEWRQWARRRLEDFGRPVAVLSQQLRLDLEELLNRLLTCEHCGRVGDGLLCLGCDQAIAMGKDPQPYTPNSDAPEPDAIGDLAQLRQHVEDSDLANRIFVAVLSDEEDRNNEWTDTAVLSAIRRTRHILAVVAAEGGLRGSRTTKETKGSP